MVVLGAAPGAFGVLRACCIAEPRTLPQLHPGFPCKVFLDQSMAAPQNSPRVAGGVGWGWSCKRSRGGGLYGWSEEKAEGVEERLLAPGETQVLGMCVRGGGHS